MRCEPCDSVILLKTLSLKFLIGGGQMAALIRLFATVPAFWQFLMPLGQLIWYRWSPWRLHSATRAWKGYEKNERFLCCER